MRGKCRSLLRLPCLLSLAKSARVAEPSHCRVEQTHILDVTRHLSNAVSQSHLLSRSPLQASCVKVAWYSYYEYSSLRPVSSLPFFAETNPHLAHSMASKEPKLAWAQLVAQPPPCVPKERAEPVTRQHVPRTKPPRAHQPAVPRPRHPKLSRPTVNGQAGNLLLRLPGELRNTIYSLTLLEEKPIIAFQVASELFKSCEAPQPPLSLTCKQLRQEVLGYWLAGNAFVVCPPPDKWVKRGNLGAWVSLSCSRSVELKS